MAVARLDQLQYHNATSLVPFLASLIVSLKAGAECKKNKRPSVLYSHKH